MVQCARYVLWDIKKSFFRYTKNNCTARYKSHVIFEITFWYSVPVQRLALVTNHVQPCVHYESFILQMIKTDEMKFTILYYTLYLLVTKHFQL